MTVCTKCKIDKSDDNFRKDSRKRNNLRSICKKCDSSKTYEWNLSHPEQHKEHYIKWKETHRESVLAKLRDYGKEWYKKNKTKKDAQNREYDRNHKKESSERTKKYVKNHPEIIPHIRQRNKIWAKNNPDKIISYGQNRRALELGNGGMILPNEWNHLKKFYGNMCLRCGRSGLKLTLDHIVPLKLGGKNLITNAQPLCKSCNSHKHLNVIDYRPYPYIPLEVPNG